ncbi:MAG: hypothetical protein IPG16_02795 [Comamonadaceae bacterium]|nr:hypothetical protein [Comamonadaceae bacterium]
MASDLTHLARTWHAQGWAYTAAGRPELAALAWAHARDIEEALMGAGIALTDLGQTLTSGERAYGCPHMAQWWPVFTRLQILRGRIKACLDIVQAYGWSDKSGGTHGQGTAVDVTQTDAGIVADAREAGARGTWCRGKRWGQASMGDHIHLALDCPCASGSDYQIGAADDGYNGLGYLGRGGRDYHPAPKVRRDWKAGIAWMQAEIARLTPKPTPTPTPEDDTMTPDQIDTLAQRIGREVAAALLDSPIGGDSTDRPASVGWGIYRVQSVLMRVEKILVEVRDALKARP